MSCQSSMSCVVVFESPKVSLGGIGCGRDARAGDVLEHVGQSFDEHRSSGPEIAPNPLTRASIEEWGSIDAIPSRPVSEESSSVHVVEHLQYASEQRPQLLGIDAFGIGAAPALSLPLDMQQTSLNHDAGPGGAERAFELWISIDGSRDRTQTATLQLAAHIQHSPLAFFDTEESRDHSVRGSIDEHHDPDPPAVQEGPVHHNMPMTRQIPLFGRRVTEPIPDDAAHLPCTQAALFAQLTDRVPTTDPAREPHPLACPTCDTWRRSETVTAFLTPPTLTTGC